MFRYKGWHTKPPLGCQIIQGHPLAQGIVACFLANEGGGPLVDLVTGNSIALSGSAVRTNDQFGEGINCNGASSGATLQAWSKLKSISQECTVLFRGKIASGGGAFSTLFGVAYSNPSADPYYCYFLDRGATGAEVRINWNSGGVQSNLIGTNTAYDGSERQYVGVIRGGSRLCEIWEDVRSIGSGNYNFGPNFTASSHIDIGYGGGLDSKTIFRHGYIWDRALRAEEIQQLFIEPYGFIKKRVFYFTTGANFNISFSDALNITDSISLVGPPPDYFFQIGESLANFQDAVPQFTLGIPQQLSDTIDNFVDAFSTMVNVPIEAFDSLQFNWADEISFGNVIIERLSTGDALSFSDSVTVVRNDIYLSLTLADTINLLSDAIRLWTTLKIVKGDNLVLSDALQTRMNHLMRIAELIPGFLEQVQVSTTGNPAFQDSVDNLADSVSIALTVQLVLSKSDSLNLTDSVSVSLSGVYNPQSFISRIRRYLGDLQSS